MIKCNAIITGVAGNVPDYILTNKELESMVDTNDEWITQRTGIKERRILKDKNKGSSDLAVPAIKKLLEKTNTKPEEVDLIICATATPDHLFPSTANIISDKIGLKNAFGYDISAACSGFLFALVTGSKFIETQSYKKIIIVGADKMSSIVDYDNRATCIIFGDGAAAVMLEPSENSFGIQDSILKSDGSGREFLYQRAGGSVRPANLETVKAKEHFIFQEGANVFKSAVTNMANVSKEIMERNNLTSEDISWLVPHQANLRIVEATRKKMGISKEKVMINIQRYGNTTNGSIPLCLAEWENKLNPSENIILSAFGGGYSWGAVYLKWAY